MKPCKYNCKYYSNNSTICKGYTSMCATYRKLIYWFRRYEIVGNMIEGYTKKEKHHGGLDSNDNMRLDALESEARTLVSSIKEVGVRIK